MILKGFLVGNPTLQSLASLIPTKLYFYFVVMFNEIVFSLLFQRRWNAAWWHSVCGVGGWK